MPVLLIPSVVDVDDYLSGEALSPVKHEYLGGIVHAMAGGTIAHNAIASNVLIALGAQLRGHVCRPFNSDMKIRVRLASQTRFYYPDASVICRSNPPETVFQDEPAFVLEVLSPDSRRVDLVEKREAYLSIPSLSLYLLLEQESASAQLFRRVSNGFTHETYHGLDATIALPEIAARLSLAEVYEGVTFSRAEE